MNRSDVIAAAAQRSGLTPQIVDQALAALQSVVTEALVKGEKVTLPGFLSFEAVQRSAREGRNPATGEKMHIPARTAVKVSAGQSLKRAVSGA
ncbi:MAG: HU family DNA-binding protein [Actinomycetota bacterium]|nr:HU family DNA-binding protein [Actinomycetota bacterium]